MYRCYTRILYILPILIYFKLNLKLKIMERLVKSSAKLIEKLI